MVHNSIPHIHQMYMENTTIDAASAPAHLYDDDFAVLCGVSIFFILHLQQLFIYVPQGSSNSMVRIDDTALYTI
jgi:hypothetical protein